MTTPAPKDVSAYASIWDEIQAERERAHVKHGATSMESADPLDPEAVHRDIITEEWGEVAQEYNEARHERRQVDCAKLRAELIQMSAMTGAWADSLTALATSGQEACNRDGHGCHEALIPCEPAVCGSDGSS
jgi:hypothetical protein